jgi:hypothetical protein
VSLVSCVLAWAGCAVVRSWRSGKIGKMSGRAIEAFASVPGGHPAPRVSLWHSSLLLCSPSPSSSSLCSSSLFSVHLLVVPLSFRRRWSAPSHSRLQAGWDMQLLGAVGYAVCGFGHRVFLKIYSEQKPRNNMKHLPVPKRRVIRRLGPAVCRCLCALVVCEVVPHRLLKFKKNIVSSYAKKTERKAYGGVSSS